MKDFEDEDKFLALSVHATKAPRGRRDMVPLILNLDSRWISAFIFVPHLLYSRGNKLGTITHRTEAWLDPGSRLNVWKT
jgi:hypothetical protein